MKTEPWNLRSLGSLPHLYLLQEPLLQSLASGPWRRAWRRNSRLSLPLPPFPASLVRNHRGDPRLPRGPAPPGSGSGDEEGRYLRSRRKPGALVPAGFPHPHSSPSRGFTLPPRPSPWREGEPTLPLAQDPPDVGIPTKKPGRSGRAWPNGAGAASKYAGPRAAYPPTAPAARARHAIAAVATPERRRRCARGPGPVGLGLQTHRLRRARLSSGSRLGSAAAGAARAQSARFGREAPAWQSRREAPSQSRTGPESE